MPRELRLAPAMAPTASVAWPSLKSLVRIVMTKLDLETKVVVAFAVWFILRYLQSILGPKRRRSRHWSVQYGAWATYYLPTVAAFYAANAVYTSSSHSSTDVILVIACSVLLFASARGAVTMTRFALDNGPQRLESWRLLLWLLYFAWLGWRWIWLDRKMRGSDVVLSFIAAFITPVIYVVVAKPQVSFLDYETKQFADYMMRQSRSALSLSSSLSPFFLRAGAESADSPLYYGCEYPFIQRKDGTWIPFCAVLQPGDDSAVVGPDICLSYIFCRLLARRYFGFPCAEDGDPQVRQLVVTELTADHNRAFSIVEVQLALLHDYFFTSYHSNKTTGFVSVRKGVLTLLTVTSLFIVIATTGLLIALLIGGGYKKEGHSGVVSLVAISVPVVIMIMGLKLPETPFLPRYWHPIQNAFLDYDERDDKSPVPDSSRLHCWREKLSQYSVMEDYDHRRSYKKIIIALCKTHLLSQVSYSFINHHPEEGKEVTVPDSVRRSVARAIMRLNGPPTISTMRSLHDLSWTYRQDTLTHTVLIWHIATSYCDMMIPQSQSKPLVADNNTNREVATILSRYCAYLVAFLPELLPEQSLSAKVILQQVLQEPKDLLGTTRMSMEEKRRRIQGLELRQDPDESTLTTFEKGVRLGRQLEEQQPDVSLRWKAMADFWAEMILYLASSDNNAVAHVEQLAQGGEFITHLWAMLSNAGILNKGSEQWTPQQPNKAAIRVEHDAPQPEEKPATAFLRRTKSAKT